MKPFHCDTYLRKYLQYVSTLQYEFIQNIKPFLYTRTHTHAYTRDLTIV